MGVALIKPSMPVSGADKVRPVMDRRAKLTNAKGRFTERRVPRLALLAGSKAFRVL